MNQKNLLLILLQNFSVQDLEGNHIKDVKTSVIVTNKQRLFKFQNITATAGDFYVEYIFPDDGTHQVIIRTDTKTTIIPASFSVFVPHQSPPSILNPFLSHLMENIV
jgi:plastocyanin